MKNAYTPFRVLQAEADPGTPVALTVQNRFNFTNLSETRLAWALNGRPMGAVPASLEPHASGRITIPAAGTKAGDRVSLTVTDRRGVEVAHEVFTIGGPAAGTSIEAPAAIEGVDPIAALAEAANAIGLGGNAALLRPLPLVLPLNREGGAATAAGTQLVNEIAPFSPLPPDSVVSGPERRGSEAVFTVAGSEVSGTVTMRPAAQLGSFDVSYRLEAVADVNPRQWGLVFTLPRAFDTLRWVRAATWSWYPDDHIGRPAGTAKANPVARRAVEEPRVALSTPWSLDANALGTNDFRSTKARIREASLSAAGGRTWKVVSADASQSVRAWVDGDCVRVLVAGFTTGGYDQFFATHYTTERRPLKKGDVIAASFRLVMSVDGK
jgi:hypothetical protein